MIGRGRGRGRGGGGVTECIVCAPGQDPLTFSFLSFLVFVWVGILRPQLSKVLKLVRRDRRVHISGAV